MFNHRKKGQSTVEYIVLVSAVLFVTIIFMTGNQTGGFRDKVNSTLKTTLGLMDTSSQRFANAQQTSINTAATSAISVDIRK